MIAYLYHCPLFGFKPFQAEFLSHITQDKYCPFVPPRLQHIKLERERRLPSTFMLLPPHSWHPDVWTDVARMRTLNMIQQRKGQQSHLCPLQFDIVNRLIVQLSNPGDVVYDPFGGLMTVPYCAIKLNRFGVGCELNPGYFADGVRYCQSAAIGNDTPTLFDIDGDEADDDEIDADEIQSLIESEAASESPNDQPQLTSSAVSIDDFD